MMTERSFRRLPLRDLLNDAEKRVRDMIEQFTGTWLARAAELRDLSRPIRKRSHYPTFHVLRTALQDVIQANEEAHPSIDYLTQELNEILQHARRERLTRR